VIPLLRKVEFFGGLPDEDLERLAGIVDGMDLASGETLFREGSRGDAFYIVYEGAVELLKSRTGGDPEKLAVRRAGDAFGEMALVDDAPRSATARALEDSRLVTIHREAFLGLIGGDNISLRWTCASGPWRSCPLARAGRGTTPRR
jgi:CRP-like cAMP-binding protein